MSRRTRSHSKAGETLYIKSQFQEFRDKKQFIDCYLVCPRTERYQACEYPAHRIVLAHKSQTFFNQFKTDKSLKINIEHNPDNVFPLILDFMYTGHLHITTPLLPALLKVATFYEIKELIPHLEKFYKIVLIHRTAVELCPRFLDYGISKYAEQAVPLLALNFYDPDRKLDIHAQDSLSTRRDIIRAADANIFSLIMKDPIFAQTSDSDKAGFIDDFVRQKARDGYTPTTEEKELLSSVIDWSKPDSYKFLAVHACDWVPTSVSQSLYSKIINMRRSTLTNFKKEVQAGTQNQMNQWYPFVWFSEVFKAEDHQATPTVDALSYLSTLGGSCKPIDLINFGIVKTKGSGLRPGHQETRIKMYSAESFICSEGPFFSNGVDKDPPYLYLDFGKRVNFNLTKMIFTSPTDGNKCIDYTVRVDQGKEEKNLKSVNNGVHIKKGKGKLECSAKSIGNAFCVRQTKPNSVGRYVLRLSKWEIFGQFLPQ